MNFRFLHNPQYIALLKEGLVNTVIVTCFCLVFGFLLGLVIALIFVGIPFVVRAVQPVLEKMDGQYEEAAFMLGASRRKTFLAVILPELRPALLTGFGLAFARGIGEYGSVIYISGNSAKDKTQVISYVIMQKLGMIDYESATAIALLMLIISFVLLLFINIVQARQSARTNLL